MFRLKKETPKSRWGLRDDAKSQAAPAKNRTSYLTVHKLQILARAMRGDQVPGVSQGKGWLPSGCLKTDSGFDEGRRRLIEIAVKSMSKMNCRSSAWARRVVDGIFGSRPRCFQRAY